MTTYISLKFIWHEENFVLVNCPFDDMAWPTTHNGKIVKRKMSFKMFKPHYNWWEVGQLLEMVVNPLLDVPTLGYGRIYKIFFYAALNQKQYKVTIGNFLACTYLDFVIMLLGLLG
jgi:hypothetical protein